MANLRLSVYVKGANGQTGWVRPGEEIPDWAYAVVSKNPSLWDGPIEPPKVAEDAPKLPEPEPTPTTTKPKRTTRKAAPKES
ncbi:hypothetical protein SEA_BRUTONGASTER_24 [Gordonia phage BrutonGaster]|uniref:Uncharacterized protein n=1 Tax=Gordonia phage BrutonGaster TaxID=2530116 RepID=A0A482JHJ3_9CAUD|nr:hypothetical protein HOV26_gp158 [Gordonia phage BrutonGaster]QBP33241.1 hypothetical protein SEA_BRUTONGASTER_24 [Gordonia phage BrutonGaster]